MKKGRRKPTRRDLLIVIEKLQSIIGDIDGNHHNDRSQEAHAKAIQLLKEGQKLCIEARSFEPPILGKSRNGW